MLYLRFEDQWKFFEQIIVIFYKVYQPMQNKCCQPTNNLKDRIQPMKTR